MNSHQSLAVFMGTDCSHCKKMESTIEAAERQVGIKIEKIEVWHNPDNQEKMEPYADQIREACGGVMGVPSFVNESTGEVLCGEQDVDTLIKWARKNK